MSSRHARVSFALVASLGVATTSARAQEDTDQALSGRHKSVSSPQHFDAEVRISPFKPDVDGDPALHGNTPYATAFGSGPRVLFGLEFDWQALRIPHFGTIGPGVAVGYTAISGTAQPTQPHVPAEPSGESTSLDIYPFDGMAVLRVDVLWREVGIPLEPYLKAGIGWSLWRASNTLGTSVYVDPTTNKSVSGTGGSIGTHFAVGLGFNLNVLDQYAAKGFDESMGVNSTYLFAEWTREDLAGLGIQSNPLRVGGTSWTFGLSFEF